ncbi:MAG: protein kinase [Myxococcaceae bacterium]|nr:protein kinase [Myxococcaceae bacterium]
MTDALTIPSLGPVHELFECPACGTTFPFEPMPPPSGGGLAPLQVRPCPGCGKHQVVQDPNVDLVVKEKWRLDRRLGAGGMGTVYLATDLSVDREVAIKFLHPRLVAQAEYRERFVREARVMAQVEHPHLVALYAAELDGDVPFLVMNVARGRPLARLMKERGALSLAEALPLVRQIVAALSALHARGLVHRDLKPGNVMVSTSGHVMLLDFGLTRSHETLITRPGTTVGSPHYMSPEQVMQGPLDARSDQYALALVTAELLVGRRPFANGPTAVVFEQHLREAPELPHVINPKVPLQVSQVLLRGLKKRPHERYPSIEAFLVDLERAAGPAAKDERTDQQLQPEPLTAMSAPVLDPSAAITPRAGAPSPEVPALRGADVALGVGRPEPTRNERRPTKDDVPLKTEASPAWAAEVLHASGNALTPPDAPPVPIVSLQPPVPMAARRRLTAPPRSNTPVWAWAILVGAIVLSLALLLLR